MVGHRTFWSKEGPDKGESRILTTEMNLTGKNAVCVPMIPTYRGRHPGLGNLGGSAWRNLGLGQHPWDQLRPGGRSGLHSMAEPQDGFLLEPWVKGALIPAPLLEELKKQPRGQQ